MGDGGGDDGLDAHRRVLGVTREATIGDVRRAFLEVAKRAHPDVATTTTTTTTTRGGGGRARRRRRPRRRLSAASSPVKT